MARSSEGRNFGVDRAFSSGVLRYVLFLCRSSMVDRRWQSNSSLLLFHLAPDIRVEVIYTGSAHPVIRSRGIVDGMSPKELAELIMDSSRVNVYNKMSLGREDVRVLQTGVDTHDPETGRRGETKIVKNVTKPPLTKKMLEFVTLMHARRLGGGEEGLEGSEGYLIVSRAISVSSGDRNSYDDKKSKVVRSEILLGVNIMRSVKGRDDATELVAVTHVNSPLTPMMMAQKLGKKGAVDFLRDIRIAASGLMQ
mmetsp:Transcript_22323/g.51150  ORF Transcript_22323/g.51150 Transcript_22323/m.51150 type:complete len:252 (-) Transcript_22323:268-1023(-)